MTMTSVEDWELWSKTYSTLPYVQSFPLEPNHRIISWEKAWKKAAECSFVLESGKGGRYSFLGLHPTSTIHGKGSEALITTETDSFTKWGKPLELVKEWMLPFRTPIIQDAPKFIGGCVGYWGYDVVRSIEKITETAADDMTCPDYYFMRINELWIVDHQENKLFCAMHIDIHEEDIKNKTLYELYQSVARQVLEMKKLWDEMTSKTDQTLAVTRNRVFTKASEQDKLSIDVEAVEGIQTVFKKDDYLNAVRKIQQYISQGDVFQVNLSVRQHRELKTDPEDIYEWLRLFNPSPYMGLLRFPEFQLVSASPELLVKLEGDKVSTRPIAGTRRRGIDINEDQKLSEELMFNEKERAEHIMLLDLERNDLGRVSEYGSVRVSEFMVIEYYSHVMHIVSEVEGRLCKEKDLYDVIAATFPGGTITGAPKIRTMEIIEELEPVRRGPYTGSIGWIDYNGNMEFNITIRTLITMNQIGYIQAGAGIVIDSDPLREYLESLSKAKALWKAIQYSEKSWNETMEGALK